jgi:hypothetical protein
MPCNLLLQLGRIRSNKLINLLSVLEDHEGRHSADSVFLSEVGVVIDVDFEVSGVGVFLGELLYLRSDSL